MSDFMSDGAFGKMIEQAAELQSAQLQQVRNGSSTTPQGNKCAECAAAGKSCFLSQSFLEKELGGVIGKKCSFGGSDDDEGCGCKVSRHFN